jgi:hypothetical protein
MTFQKGKPVFILEGPEGTPWAIKAYCQLIDTSLTYNGLTNLGAELKPTAGWVDRVTVLDQELTISTPEGYNWIVQDELPNTYDEGKDDARNFQT